ncbi:MAG: EAL domain-containing protein [Wenzhouxiangellaceae bacterium]
MDRLWRRVVFLLLLAACGTAAAQSPVRVGIYSNPPKIYRDEAGRPAGLFADLIEAMARREDWKLEWVSCEWADCLVRLESGEIDLMPDVAFSPGRAQRFAFHQVAVVQSWGQLYALPETSLVSLDELDGRSVSVLRDSIQEEFLISLQQRTGIRIDLQPQPDLDHTLRAVVEGEAEFGITNHLHGQRHAYALGLVEMPVVFNQASLFFAATPARPELLPRIDDHLSRWKQNRNSPYYRALLNTLAPAPETILPRWFLPLLAGALGALLLLMLLVHWMRRRVESTTRELRQSGERLEQLLDAASVVLYSLEYPSMQVLWVTPNFERITGFPIDSAFVPGWWESVVHSEDRESVRRRNQELESGKPHTLEYRIRDRNGRLLFVRDEKRLIPHPDHPDDPARGTIMGSWSDITDSRRHDEQLDFLAFHDRLTSLPNRARFSWQLDRLLERTGQQNRTCCVLLIDLDRFKSINETVGENTGDRMLRLIAGRLMTCVRDDDLLARYGNDEFCIATVTNADDCRHRIEQVLAEVRKPIPLGERDLMLTASIGVAESPQHGEDAETLLRHAAQALELARASGGNQWIRFRPELRRREISRVFLENDLRLAIEHRQFELYFQPQVQLGNAHRTGLETLVRWAHPELGMLLPGRFIPLAEQTGLIEAIDRCVIENVCRQLGQWLEQGRDPERLAFNVSVRSLYDQRLPVLIADLLERHRIPAGRLMLEVTETLLMENIDRARRVLAQLHELGIGISIDDFGHGYSNLSYLTRLTIDQVKLDQSLVSGLESSEHARTLVGGLIRMFDEMGVEVIAEGIETAGQRDLLIAAGCRLGQGWLFGKPLAADRLAWEPTISMAEDS